MPPDTDPVIREIREALARLERALLGDIATPGMAERLRHVETRQVEQHERTERHSRRLLDLEQAGANRMRWTLRAIVERGIGVAIAAAAGWLAALSGPRPPHP